jgi:hypothetical protein
MSFWDRKYYVYLIIAGSKVKRPYYWDTWQEIVPLIDAFAQSGRGTTSVRSSQLFNGKPIAFGRLGWNEASHRKWTHSSPATLQGSALWDFLGAEVWSPSWTQCERDDAAPDFYCKLWGGHRTPAAVLLAFYADEHSLQRREIEIAVRCIGDIVEALEIGYCDRLWGEPIMGGYGFQNSLQDLHLSTIPPDSWEILSADG